jgi:hypothetical protein
VLGSLVQRTPFTAARAHLTRHVQGPRQCSVGVEDGHSVSNEAGSFMTSVGASLNLAVNELADVLHTFFVNVVVEDQ